MLPVIMYNFKQTEMKKRLRTAGWSLTIFWIAIGVYSCQQEELVSKSEIQQTENFVNLSTIEDIAEGINFPVSGTAQARSEETQIKKVNSIHEIKNDHEMTSFYIVNYDQGGYVILSADKRTPPILGFSLNNEFIVDENAYPPGLKYWMNDTKEQISYVQISNLIQSTEERLAWEQVQQLLINNVRSSSSSREDPWVCYDHTETTTVGPLMSTTWQQLGGFNDALPIISCNGYNFQIYAGCVPIAMGQVMRYHEYPNNYDWASMPLTSWGATVTTANFIADIHDAIGSVYSGWPSYDCDGTGVSGSANMGTVLKTQFSYSSARRANYNYNTVKSNLNYGRPVILSGDNGSTGHMWVCDGYKQTSYYNADCTGGTYYPLFHMNWGWQNGAFNEWYSYNNFNPGNTNYNNNKKMIYNIIP